MARFEYRFLTLFWSSEFHRQYGWSQSRRSNGSGTWAYTVLHDTERAEAMVWTDQHQEIPSEWRARNRKLLAAYLNECGSSGWQLVSHVWSGSFDVEYILMQRERITA